MQKKLLRLLAIFICINLVFHISEINYFEIANAAPPKPRFKKPKIKKTQSQTKKSNKISFRKKFISKIKGKKHLNEKSIAKAKGLKFRKNFEKASQSKGIENAKKLQTKKQFNKVGREENKSKKTGSFGSLTKAKSLEYRKHFNDVSGVKKEKQNKSVKKGNSTPKNEVKGPSWKPGGF